MEDWLKCQKIPLPKLNIFKTKLIMTVVVKQINIKSGINICSFAYRLIQAYTQYVTTLLSLYSEVSCTVQPGMRRMVCLLE